MNIKFVRLTLISSSCLGLAFAFVGCSAADHTERVGARSQTVYNFEELNGVFSSTGVDGSLRSNVVVSVWQKNKWSQPGAHNDGDGCSGALVTPVYVLTSASCIRRLGTPSQVDVYVGPKTPDVAGPGEATKFEGGSIQTFSSPSSQPSFSGDDLALIRLQTPVLEQALIHRQVFTAPSPLAATDANGWAPYAAGISGWSPFTSLLGYYAGGGSENSDAATIRQTFYKANVGQDEFRLNRANSRWVATTMKPVTNLPKLGTAPGDNGGPLFTRGSNNRLDIIGVASLIGSPVDALLSPTYNWSLLPAHFQSECVTPPEAPSTAPYQCDFWTDVTQTTVKNTLINALADTTRTAKWLASHPRVGEGQSGQPWIGEVDYGGACDTTNDPDCDHIYTWNANATARDNCPAVANFDQLDTLDSGLGDACTGCKDDSVCTPAAPRCKGSGLTSKCVQCLVDADCGLGFCDPQTNSCRAGANGCNTFQQTGQLIAPVSASGVMPAATRGTFVPGTYVLTGIQTFGTAEAPSEGQTVTVAVNGSITILNSYETLPDTPVRWTANFATNSNPPVFTYTCATPLGYMSAGTTDHVDYTIVNGTTFWLLYTDWGVRYIYTKQ